MEKSVLKLGSISDINLGLATCGSNISDVHIKLLVEELKVQELYLCYDKEYINDIEYETYFNRLSLKASKLTPYMKVKLVMDHSNKLELKDSPVDKGYEVFEYLINTSINIKEFR